jgi:hypothetical protein
VQTATAVTFPYCDYRSKEPRTGDLKGLEWRHCMTNDVFSKELQTRTKRLETTPHSAVGRRAQVVGGSIWRGGAYINIFASRSNQSKVFSCSA